LAEISRPNLLYIHTDQHCPQVTGCYGDPIVETPNLDRLAATGVTFDNCYCPSPICVPSRMSTLTGRHPHENRCWTNDHSLDPGIPTFAHAMGAAGYWPVLIGRMHSVGPDQLHGYADRLVGDHGPNYLGGVGANHGKLHGTAGPDRVSLRLSGPGQSAYQVHDEYVTAATVHRLQEIGTAKRAGVDDKPFCITVGYMLPHQPFVARVVDYAQYADRVGMPANPAPYADDLHPYFHWWRERCGIKAVSDEETLRARASYWGLVTRMDAMIGEIMDTMRAYGLDQNTLVVYSSDHGEQLGEHGLWWKQTFYEHAVRVPAILSWPGALPEGVRSERVCSSYDLNATMLDALDAPALPNSHGRSLLPLAHEPNASWDDVAFSEYCTDLDCYHRMIRCGNWKLNYYAGQEPQLFNLAEDPHELVDRAQDPGCQAVRRDLEGQILDGWDLDRVKRQMKERHANLSVLRDWGRSIKPTDTYRWNLMPEMDYLDPTE